MKWLVILLALAAVADAQTDPSAIDKVFLQTGTTLSGKIVSCDQESIQLTLSTGLRSDVKLARVKGVRFAAPNPEVQKQIAVGALKVMNPALAYDTSENSGLDDLRVILGYPGLKEGLDNLVTLGKDEFQAKKQRDLLARQLAEIKDLPARAAAIQAQIDRLDANPPPAEVQVWQPCMRCNRTGRIKSTAGGVTTTETCPECGGARRISVMMENSRGIAQWNQMKNQATTALAQVRSMLPTYFDTNAKGEYVLKPDADAEAAKGEADYLAAQQARAKAEQDLQAMCPDILKRVVENL